MDDLDKTVILTFASQAWTAPASLQDLLLESFRQGVGTEPLLKHLVIVADGAKTYEHCQHVHPLCYHLQLEPGGVDYVAQQSYMAKGYLEIVWRKFLSQARVLQLGYSFVFTVSTEHWCRGPSETYRAAAAPIGAERSAAELTDACVRSCMLMYYAGIMCRRMWTSSGCGTHCCASR